MRLFVTDYEATFRVRAPFRWQRHPGSMLHGLLKAALDHVDDRVTARLLLPRVPEPAPHYLLKAGSEAPAALFPVLPHPGEAARDGLAPGDHLHVRLRRLGRADPDIDQCIIDALTYLDRSLIVEHAGLCGPRERPVEIADHPTQDTRASLSFITPGRIEWTDETRNNRVSEDVPFSVLIGIIRRRVETVCALYGELPGRPSNRFIAELHALAPGVTRTRSSLRRESWQRMTTGRDGLHLKHRMAGLLGEIEFEGPLGPLVPTLLAAQEIHIGKNISMGLGRFVLTLGDHGPPETPPP